MAQKMDYRDHYMQLLYAENQRLSHRLTIVTAQLATATNRRYRPYPVTPVVKTSPVYFCPAEQNDKAPPTPTSVSSPTKPNLTYSVSEFLNVDEASEDKSTTTTTSTTMEAGYVCATTSPSSGTDCFDLLQQNFQSGLPAFAKNGAQRFQNMAERWIREKTGGSIFNRSGHPMVPFETQNEFICWFQQAFTAGHLAKFFVK